jgi:hypothetical protein
LRLDFRSSEDPRATYRSARPALLGYIIVIARIIDISFRAHAPTFKPKADDTA